MIVLEKRGELRFTRGTKTSIRSSRSDMRPPKQARWNFMLLLQSRSGTGDRLRPLHRPSTCPTVNHDGQSVKDCLAVTGRYDPIGVRVGVGRDDPVPVV